MEAICECCGVAHRGVTEAQLTYASIEEPLGGLVLRVEHCPDCMGCFVGRALRIARSMVDDVRLSHLLAPGILAAA